MQPPAPRPLDGYRILDLSDETGFLAGRMLAELGADVIKVEPPAGDPARFRPPYVGGIADPERSITWLAYNAGKRGVTLDLASTAGRALFDRLCTTADAVIETFDPLTLLELSLDYETLHAAHPQLVVCSITPFGRTGPYARHRASDLTITAMGGNMALTGDPDRAPLRCTMPSSYYHGGAEAASGLLVALLARAVIGEGQHVDVSLQAAMVSTIMTGASQWAMDERDRSRTGAAYPVGKTLQREVWRCRDGFVSFALRGGPARIPGLMATERWLAEERILAPAWEGRDWKAYNHNDLTQEQVDTLSAPLAELFLQKPMRELFEESIRRGVMLAPVNDAREIAQSAQLRSREFFVEVTDAKRGLTYELPARFARMSRYATDVRGAAPVLGEHDAEVYGSIGATAARTSGGAPPQPRLQTRPKALAGLKVLELGGGAAGPIAVRHLADHGATVIRIESATRPDFLRVLGLSSTNKSLDRAPMFMMLNCNKMSVALNLSDPRGVALAKRLVLEWCDVLAENYAPKAMRKWGLDYETLAKEKPDLIMVSTCLMGQTGPNKDYPGFGGQGSAISGFNFLTGWPDREATGQHGTITDSLAPRFVAAAVLAALLRKQRTGEGTYIDVAQVETAAYSLSGWMLEYFANDEVVQRDGNRSRVAAPHGAFPCMGDDRWCTIACHEDADWQRLVAAIGSPQWARDARFGTIAGRKRDEDEIERGIASWTRERTAEDVMATLQATGVEAGIVETCRDLNADRQLAHRGHFHSVQHAVLGDHTCETLGYALSATPGTIEQPGPLLGEHTAHVYRSILGLSAEEVGALAAEGVLR